jgi:hypothetical protein
VPEKRESMSPRLTPDRSMTLSTFIVSRSHTWTVVCRLGVGCRAGREGKQRAGHTG